MLLMHVCSAKFERWNRIIMVGRYRTFLSWLLMHNKGYQKVADG